MTQFKKLAATTVAALALVPALGVSSASADTADARLDAFNAAADLSALNEIVAAQGGCTTTYESNVARLRPGAPTVTLPSGQVVVTYSPTVTYAVAVAGATVAFINCVV